jgi:hypothetical protein
LQLICTQGFEVALLGVNSFNAAPRNYFIPKINMRKFDGKDPITWIFQMEKYSDLHQLTTLQKVPIASLYLGNDQFVCNQWICERKNISIISWSIFTYELISHYEDINRNTLFSQLINLQNKGPITEHFQQFQKLNLRVKNIPWDNL